jgi:hypothetical protein
VKSSIPCEVGKPRGNPPRIMSPAVKPFVRLLRECTYSRETRRRDALERSGHIRTPTCDRASAPHANEEPARTAVRRRAPAAEDHSQRLRQKAGAETHVRSTDPCPPNARLRFTEFERRHLAAPRKELDEEYEASTTPPARHPNHAFPAIPRLDPRGACRTSRECASRFVFRKPPA